MALQVPPPSFCCSVDVNLRFAGGLLMVGAGPIELSVTENNTALGENRPLQFRDSPGIGQIGPLGQRIYSSHSRAASAV